MKTAISIIYASLASCIAATGYIFSTYADWSIVSIFVTLLFYALTLATNSLTSNVAVKIWLLSFQAISLIFCIFMLWLNFSLESKLAMLASILTVIVSIAVTSISIFSASKQKR